MNFPPSAVNGGLLGDPNEMKLRGTGTNQTVDNRLVQFIALKNNDLFAIKR